MIENEYKVLSSSSVRKIIKIKIRKKNHMKFLVSGHRSQIVCSIKKEKLRENSWELKKSVFTKLACHGRFNTSLIFGMKGTAALQNLLTPKWKTIPPYQPKKKPLWIKKQTILSQDTETVSKASNSIHVGDGSKKHSIWCVTNHSIWCVTNHW